MRGSRRMRLYRHHALCHREAGMFVMDWIDLACVIGFGLGFGYQVLWTGPQRFVVKSTT